MSRNEEKFMVFSKQKTSLIATYDGKKYQVLRFGRSQWIAMSNDARVRGNFVAKNKVDAVLGLHEQETTKTP